MAKQLTPQINPLKRAIKGDGTQKVVNIAYERFRDKPYAERNRGLYLISKAALLFFHFLSIVFAFFFVFTFALNMISGLSLNELSYTPHENLLIGASALITLILLYFVEAGKTVVGKAFADTYLKTKAVIIPALVVLIALIAFSVTTSVNGGVVVAEYQNGIKEGDLKDLWSIEADYQAKIDREAAEIKALQDDPKNLVREGNSMVLGWNIRETIKKKEARKDEYLKLMATSQNRAEKKNTEVRLLSSIDSDLYKKVALIASSTVEVFIIILLFFGQIYLYYTYKEIGLRKAENNLREAKEVFDSKKTNPSPTPPIPVAKTAPAEGQNTPGAMAKDLPPDQAVSPDKILDRIREKVDFSNPTELGHFNYLTKYAAVVASNARGVSISNLAKEHSISEGTAKNVRRVAKMYV